MKVYVNPQGNRYTPKSMWAFGRGIYGPPDLRPYDKDPSITVEEAITSSVVHSNHEKGRQLIATRPTDPIKDYRPQAHKDYELEALIQAIAWGRIRIVSYEPSTSPWNSKRVLKALGHDPKIQGQRPPRHSAAEK